MFVENMKSTRSGKPVANQFVITHNGARFFQSYRTLIAKVDEHGQVSLSKDWQYSTTTSRYRNQFLMDTTAETKAKIKSGEYKVVSSLG